MIKNLLLDLDGTLIDSSTGIYHSFFSLRSMLLIASMLFRIL